MIFSEDCNNLNPHDTTNLFVKILPVKISSRTPLLWDLLFHRKTVKQCFESYHGSMHKQIKTFIDAYSTYIEPQLLTSSSISWKVSIFDACTRLMNNEMTPFLSACQPDPRQFLFLNTK